MDGKQRTVAFQVPEELFEQFKEYLKQHNTKQNAFFLDCIHRALAEAKEERVDADASAEPDGEAETDATSQGEDADEDSTAE